MLKKYQERVMLFLDYSFKGREEGLVKAKMKSLS